MFAVTEDAEALFSEVGQVQKELEKFDVKRAVDANEIYELLETHSFRSDRVQFVTTHLLVTLGLRNNFSDEDVIDVSDDSDEVYLEDLEFTSSPEYNVHTDPVVLDLSVHDVQSVAGSPVHYVCSANMNNNTNSSAGYAEALAASEVNLYPSSSILQNETEKTSEVHEIQPAAAAAAAAVAAAVAHASKTDSDVIALNTTVESSITKHNSEPSNNHVISPPTYQSDDFMCDVNNNDPNNNTEYAVPVHAEDKQEQHNSGARETDDSGMEFEDQDDVRCKLLEEARLIHRIVPRQNLEQIYSYLEANLDHKNRVQIVMQEFLRMDLAPELCDLAVSDCDSVGSKTEVSCQYSKDVSEETQVLPEPQPSTSSVRKMKTVRKNADETTIHPEPQPSTSADCKIKRKNLKPYAVNDPHRKVKMNSAKGNARLKDEQGKVSEFHPPAEKSYSKGTEHDVNKVFEETMPAADSEITTLSFASDTKHPNTWEVSSSSTSSSSSDQNFGFTDNVGEVDISSTSNLNRQTHTDSNNESSRLGWDHEVCVAKPVTSQAGNTVENLIPSSSTENVELIGTTSTEEINKRKLESFDYEFSPDKKIKVGGFNESHLLPQKEVAGNEIRLTQDQLKYKSMLMEVFPDVDPQYLERQCHTLETEESFLNMVTKLLESDDFLHQQVSKEVPVEPWAGPSSVSMPDEERVEMQYETLVAILPNADPMYLRETCEKIGSDENAMKAFVTNALETKEYPTRADYLKRQEALALQKKYTEQFSIEGFLEILPDPFKYFREEKKNDKKFTDHALAYLKGRYKRIRQEDLKSVFRHNRYSLTLACEALDSFGGSYRRTSRSEYECRIPTEINIPFLQEVAFIENKKIIQDYLKEKADRKKRAFEEAKAKGDLLECGCCFDNEVMLEDMAACNEGHLFCKECVRKGVEVQIGNGKTTFLCLSDCVAEFSLKTLQAVLKPSVLSRMLQRKQLEEVKAAGIEDLETCPFCDFASIPPHEDKVFRCLNPDCMRESCRKCKEPNHIPLRCDEVEKADEVKVRTYIEDRMTEALVRTCWKCGKKFIKEDGCNKMTCTCGALMCYICRKPVKDYSHFNAQGGDAYHKCPLYSNNDVIHVDAVREEAKKAKKEMETKNPELKLKHDPTQILPKAGGMTENLHHNAHPGPLFARLQQLGRQRGRHGIQMTVRMLAGEFDMPFVDMNGRQHPPQVHVLKPNQNPNLCTGANTGIVAHGVAHTHSSVITNVPAVVNEDTTAVEPTGEVKIPLGCLLVPPDGIRAVHANRLRVQCTVPQVFHHQAIPTVMLAVQQEQAPPNRQVPVPPPEVELPLTAQRTLPSTPPPFAHTP